MVNSICIKFVMRSSEFKADQVGLRYACCLDRFLFLSRGKRLFFWLLERPSLTYTKGTIGFAKSRIGSSVKWFPLPVGPKVFIRAHADIYLKLNNLQILFSEGKEESKCVPDKGIHTVLILL